MESTIVHKLGLLFSVEDLYYHISFSMIRANDESSVRKTFNGWKFKLKIKYGMVQKHVSPV
jgi:hypothetical protein